MKSFVESSYLMQVKRSRELAVAALASFPLRVKEVEFINHGENTTFRVRAIGGDYLCRIQRDDYHTTPAIEEELKWLEKLSGDGFSVPKPLRSKKNRLIETVLHPAMGSRRVTVFHWIEGRFMMKGISTARMHEVGVLLASFQKHAKAIPVRHRRYWDADGLVGREPKFGSQDFISIAKPHEQKLITETRKELLKRIRSYGKKFPDRMGLIHADLHHGNMLICSTGEIGAIDFDDCGFGYHVYDLTAPLVSTAYCLQIAKRSREYRQMKEAMIEGYASIAPWTEADHAALADFLTARRLMMVGWLESRKDNPKLQKRIKNAVKRAIKYIEKPNL